MRRLLHTLKLIDKCVGGGGNNFYAMKVCLT